jgi:membrane dipeptidase
MMVERLVNTWPDKLALAKSPQEIEENFKKGLLSLPMGIENGAAIEDDINNLQYFFDKGIRYMTLTHGKDNLIGDSSYDTARTNNGLSDFGKKVVLEMNRLGMIVDISHVDDKTFFDVAEVSRAPLVATHSSARHFTPGFERNVSDEIIQKIAEKKGMVMITFGGSFIDQGYAAAGDSIRAHVQQWLKTNNLTMQDSAAQAYIKSYRAQHAPTVHVSKIAEHIDHVVKLVGIDYVGLGSDFDGVGDTLPEGMKDASMYPNLIAELLKMGYSREDIEKICHKNFFRVWNDILNAAG